MRASGQDRGLADVVGALPAAMAGQGWEMRVLLPAYRALRARAKGWEVVWRAPALWGARGGFCGGRPMAFR
ncbi:hypothetical protein MASR1M32_21620 [Rhodobacter sp.]